MTATLYGQPLINFLRAGAQRRGDDPAAVLSVADVEGGFYGAVGDSGTSFGPLQLHVGGALPASVPVASARSWANSPTGLNYALDKIDAVAHGLKGQDAINAIVSKFERPADIPREQASAGALYGKYAHAKLGTNQSGLAGGGGAWKVVKGVLTWQPFPGLFPEAKAGTDVATGIGAVWSFFTKLLELFADPVRLLEVVAGLVLLVLGIVTLTRWFSRSQVVVQTVASGRALAALAA